MPIHKSGGRVGLRGFIFQGALRGTGLIATTQRQGRRFHARWAVWLLRVLWNGAQIVSKRAVLIIQREATGDLKSER